MIPASGSGWSNQLPQDPFRGETYDNALWGQVMLPQTTPDPMQQHQPSLLPMPYQGGTGGYQQAMMVTSPKVPSIHTGTEVGPMAPAIPAEEEPIHISPMYTKPRAIIPPYRAISGFISVFVVFALLCTGAVYYANASGKLYFLHQIYGDARPGNVKSSQSMLAVPQTAPNLGPASVIINSATTASKIDPTTAQPLNPTNQFSVGETIYLTYSVHPKAPGTVSAKWYTNKNLYQTSNSNTITEAASGYIQMQFLQPTEGMVELYWNDQLAVTLFFVVEPGAP
jgi:hypothetical protein